MLEPGKRHMTIYYTTSSLNFANNPQTTQLQNAAGRRCEAVAIKNYRSLLPRLLKIDVLISPGSF